MTINKAQGQTLKRVGLCLPKPVFSHAQLYVAFARVSASAHIRVLVDSADGQDHCLDDDRAPDGTCTGNVVWLEVSSET